MQHAQHHATCKRLDHGAEPYDFSRKLFLKLLRIPLTQSGPAVH
jgi:hypothetical protein